MNNENAKIFLEANIKIEKETSAMREAASSVIKLPVGKEKQIDLMYFSAIFVSSGENLNHAYFMPSELVSAENTIVNKALDVEHKEDEIIGHIYERAFIKKDGSSADIKELSAQDKSSVDKEELHIVIAGIIYKDRFPAIAKEVFEGKWKVSMETYFTHYDVKVGDMVIPVNEAEVLGITAAKYLGKSAKVFKDGAEVASGVVTRVLRNLCFSGCGIVEQPANPPSVILETAGLDAVADSSSIVEEESGGIKINLNKSKVNNLTSYNMNDNINDNKQIASADDSPGQCVSYKRRVYDSGGDSPDGKVIHDDWCSMFDASCTSFYRSAIDPECLRYKAYTLTDKVIDKLVKKAEGKEKSKKILKSVDEVFRKAEKFIKK